MYPNSLSNCYFPLNYFSENGKIKDDLHGVKMVTTTRNNVVLTQENHLKVLELEIDTTMIFCTSILNCANHTDIFYKNSQKQNRECCQTPNGKMKVIYRMRKKRPLLGTIKFELKITIATF